MSLDLLTLTMSITAPPSCAFWTRFKSCLQRIILRSLNSLPTYSSMSIVTNFVQRWFLINRNRPCPETRSKCDVGKTTYPTLMASEERLRVQVPPKSCFHPTLSMPNIEIRSCDQIW
uniref:Uncharacterized protein n=1 Tax=Cacopsylla melanoneura TaxID=428564 RepID=A0A8D9F847_9HEMI